MKDRLSEEEYKRWKKWKAIIEHHLRVMVHQKANKNMNLFFNMCSGKKI